MVSSLRDRLGKGLPQPKKAPGSSNARFLILGTAGIILCMLGILMVFSASSVNDLETYDSAWHHIRRQVVWFLLGLSACIFLIRIDYHRLRSLSQVSVWISGGLLLLVFIPEIGIKVGGASRWIAVGPLTVQPSEIAKLAIILFSADLLSRKGQELSITQNPLKTVLLVTTGISALLVLEPDYGTTLILLSIVGAIIIFAGTQMRKVMQLIGVGLFSAASVGMLASYRRERLFGLLNPWEDPQDLGWQTIQSGAAIANGGISGVGLGESRAKWGWLPEAHTDFIYAIISEEIGFIGSFFVIALYMIIGFTGLSTALKAPDVFGRLLAAGITLWIMSQAFVNIAAVLGLFPITGITLPFLSFGGNSLLWTLSAYGILLNIARQTA